MRDERDRKLLALQLGNGERDAVDRHRALLDAVAEHLRRRFDEDAQPFSFGLDRLHATHGVDMALDVVAAERIARPHGRLDVHGIARREMPERRASERLGNGVQRDPRAIDGFGSEADAAYRDRASDAELGGRVRGLDDERKPLRATRRRRPLGRAPARSR